MNRNALPVFWWKIKVVCSFLLIAGIFERYLSDLADPVFVLPDNLPRCLVIIGGAIFIVHYFMLKKHNPAGLQALVTGKGLYKYIRHPMYLGDLIMYTGFALFFPHWVTAIILGVACYALYRQAGAEDVYLSGRFAKEHKAWVESTSLIIPGV